MSKFLIGVLTVSLGFGPIFMTNMGTLTSDSGIPSMISSFVVGFGLMIMLSHMVKQDHLIKEMQSQIRLADEQTET